MIKKILLAFILFTTVKCNAQTTGTIDDKNSSLYWAGTSVFSAVNLAATTFNIIRLKRSDTDKHRANAIFGIISGSLQTAYGLANVSSTANNAALPVSLNIGIGTSTIVTSVLRLARKDRPKEKNLTYSFFYLPKWNNISPVIGLQFAKRID